MNKKETSTVHQTSIVNRCLPLGSREYALASVQAGISLTGMGFGSGDFVSTDVQAVVGTIGWRSSASRATHAQMPTAKPATRTTALSAPSTNALFETSYQAAQAATKQTRVIGLAKAAKDADRGVEGTARKRIPV